MAEDCFGALWWRSAHYDGWARNPDLICVVLVGILKCFIEGAFLVHTVVRLGQHVETSPGESDILLNRPALLYLPGVTCQFTYTSMYLTGVYVSSCCTWLTLKCGG